MSRHGIFPPEFPGPTPGRFSPQGSAAPIPVVYDQTELESLSLRAYAAIQLRVPDSGIEWLDKMILESRRLDQATAKSKDI